MTFKRSETCPHCKSRGTIPQERAVGPSIWWFCSDCLKKFVGMP
jgi:ribosomal protein L37AE/L43A